MKKKKRVFLGGTCNGSTWRDKLIPMLKIDYFNPMIHTGSWGEREQRIERMEKDSSNFLLYVITPLQGGFTSFVESVEMNWYLEKHQIIVLCVLEKDGGRRWTNHQRKSIEYVKRIVENNGGVVLNNLDEVAKYLNTSDGKPYKSPGYYAAEYGVF